MDMTSRYSLQERISRARSLHAEGYNCAQCVAMVFDDISSLPAEALAAAAAAFGGGMGGTRGTCGCVSGICLVSGSSAFGSPADKKAIYGSTASFIREFESAQQGKLLCADLRKPGAKSCMALIEESVAILHNNIERTDP